MCNLYCIIKGPRAIREDRPLFAFAGLWTRWRGVRGPKSAPVEGEHELFGFLTTEANAIVAPTHPQAMPAAIVSHAGFGERRRRITDWRRALQGGGRILDVFGHETAKLGWRPGELFDVRSGLIWRLSGERVLAVGGDGVRLRNGLTLHRRG
jgi:hypothetical protein